MCLCWYLPNSLGLQILCSDEHLHLIYWTLGWVGVGAHFISFGLRRGLLGQKGLIFL